MYCKLSELDDDKIIISSTLKNLKNIFSIVYKNGTLIESFSICPANKSLNILSINSKFNTLIHKLYEVRNIKFYFIMKNIILTI